MAPKLNEKGGAVFVEDEAAGAEDTGAAAGALLPGFAPEKPKPNFCA